MTVSVDTRPTDFDAFAHVHNTTYFDYMEVGRARWFQTGPLQTMVVIARSECDHRVEIPLGVAAVDVAVRAESCGRTSFVLLHELSVDGVPYAQGRTVMVKLDEDRRPIPLTDEERAGLLGG